MGQSPRTPWIKTGRSIRCAARIRPLEREPEPVSGLSSGRAPALHACVCLTTPVFSAYPFDSPVRGGCGRFPSGACESAFHQRWFTMPQFWPSVKKNRQKDSHKITAPALIAPAAAPERQKMTGWPLRVIPAPGDGLGHELARPPRRQAFVRRNLGQLVSASEGRPSPDAIPPSPAPSPISVIAASAFRDSEVSAQL
jgi:hypothetical protein